MELKRIGNGFHILWTTLLAVVLVGYEVVATAHLITSGDLKAVLNPLGFFAGLFIFFALVTTLISCFLVWGLAVRSQRMRTLADRDPSVVFMPSEQPDRALALRDGESLTLSYRSRGNRWLQGLGMLMLCLVCAASGEVLVFSALPVFGHSRLNPLYLEILYPPPATEPPIFLDWLTAAFPLALSTLCLVVLLWGVVASGPHVLLADDRGITYRHSGRRRFIPWNDVLLFARTLSDTRAAPVGTYALWGRSHFLMFSIQDAQHVDIGAKSRDGATRYIIEGGYEAYLTNAARLLATIGVRSYVPLLAMREPPVMGWFRRRAPVTTTSEEEARELPFAAQEYQPQVSEADASLRFDEQLVLKPRSAPLPVLAESLIWFALLCAFMAACGQLQQSVATFISLGTLTVILAAVILVPLMGLASVAFALQRRAASTPAITVDAYGITGTVFGERKPVTIPWQSISAWVVIPPPMGTSKPPRYMIFGEGRKLTWVESAHAKLAGRDIAGDREEAYRVMATRIHALIAARTGLPLRELRTDGARVAASV